jgi:hypothetical protein
MEIVRRSEKIKSVAERWKRTYQRFNGEWTDVRGRPSKDYYNKLLSAKTEVEINEIIGNESWTRNQCDECLSDREFLVSFVVEEYNFNICRDCLSKSIELIEKG